MKVSLKWVVSVLLHDRGRGHDRGPEAPVAVTGDHGDVLRPENGDVKRLVHVEVGDLDLAAGDPDLERRPETTGSIAEQYLAGGLDDDVLLVIAVEVSNGQIGSRHADRSGRRGRGPSDPSITTTGSGPPLYP